MNKGTRSRDEVKDALDAFFLRFTTVTYKSGEVITRAGDPPAGVLYLTHGHVSKSVCSPEGDILVLHVFKPGAFFPMTWVMHGMPNRFTYEALSDVQGFRAPRDEVLAFLKNHPEVLFDLTERLLSGISGLLQRTEQLVMDSAYNKTIRLLAYYATNFGQKQGDAIVFRLTHREIASWIGTTRETASLQIEMLKKRGIVSYDKRDLVVRDMSKLHAEIVN